MRFGRVNYRFEICSYWFCLDSDGFISMSVSLSLEILLITAGFHVFNLMIICEYLDPQFFLCIDGNWLYRYFFTISQLQICNLHSHVSHLTSFARYIFNKSCGPLSFSYHPNIYKTKIINKII